MPRWGDFKDDGMKPGGFRQYSAIIWDVPWGQNWELAAQTTPAVIRGLRFAGATRWKNMVTNMWGEFDYPEPRTHHDPTLNVTVKEFWYRTPGDAFGGPLTDICDWLAQMNRRINKPRLFDGLTIELWNDARARDTDDGQDWDIEGKAGLSAFPHIKLLSKYANPGTLSHEIGHIFHQRCGIDFDGVIDPVTHKAANLKNGVPRLRNGVPEVPQYAQTLAAYRALRDKEYTTRTTEVERFAEDFRFLFGADATAGYGKDDDANHGYPVRLPNKVPGLAQFFLNQPIAL